MPHVVHGGAARFQVETETQSSRMVVTPVGGVKLTGAGMVAVLAVLNTYYGGLSAARKATLPGLCTVSPTGVTAFVVPGTEVGSGGLVDTLLTTTLVAAGNTAVG